MCDAGVHPAFQGINALPYLDELDWSTVDAILITHFHLDHAASLTYIMEKVSIMHHLFGPSPSGLDWVGLVGDPTCADLRRPPRHPQTNFRDGNGVVYMSHPTKAIYRFLMSDFVRVR